MNTVEQLDMLNTGVELVEIELHWRDKWCICAFWLAFTCTLVLLTAALLALQCLFSLFKIPELFVVCGLMFFCSFWQLQQSDILSFPLFVAPLCYDSVTCSCSICSKWVISVVPYHSNFTAHPFKSYFKCIMTDCSSRVPLFFGWLLKWL